MNKRIQELVEQATDEAGLDPNLFAQLIVRECVVVLRDYNVDYVEDVLQEHLGDAE